MIDRKTVQAAERRDGKFVVHGNDDSPSGEDGSYDWPCRGCGKLPAAPRPAQEALQELPECPGLPPQASGGAAPDLAIGAVRELAIELPGSARREGLSGWTRAAARRRIAACGRETTSDPIPHGAAGGRVLQKVHPAEILAAGRTQAWLRHLDAHRHDIFLGVNPVCLGAWGRTKAAIGDVLRVYLDIDEDGE